MTKAKNAVIAGGSGYLGRSLVNELRRRGWQAITLSWRAVGKDNYVCDVRDPKAVRETIEDAVTKFGPISAVIHAASPPLERVPLLKASAESFKEHMTVALLGARNLLEAVSPHMEAGGVFIAITTSAASSDHAPPLGAYIAAKRAMTDYLAEVAQYEHGFRIVSFPVDFLPGGLNRDLPDFALNFFAKKAESLDSVVRRIVDECGLD